MLSLDKESFFNQRQLPKRSYCYINDGKNYEITSDYVISRIGSSEGKALFLLRELNASDDFLLNVYLQDFADKCVQDHLKGKLMAKVSNSLLDKLESYKFTLNTIEYVAYKDDEGKFHLDKIDEVGKFVGWARYSRFEQQLSGILDMHTFDCEIIEKTEEV